MKVHKWQEKQWILASASPRRRELLKLLVPVFRICTAQVEETTVCLQPQDMVMDLAQKKAEAVAALLPKEEAQRSLILGADTLVYCQGQVLGKPKDATDARRMLTLLANNTHQVYTGLCILDGAEKCTGYEKTDVMMDAIEEEEMTAYIETGDPLDKAGAYGIQGYASRFIKGIHGCYFNVVGLPVRRLYEMVKTK